MQDLSGRMVIVTGAFGALGSSVADMLAERGAKLARVDRADNPGGPGWRLGGIDLADEDSCKRAFRKAVEDCGPVYGLVNIAGAFEMASLAEGGIDPWDRMYRTNLRTVLSASSAALPYFKGAGRIVNIGAAAAAKASASMGAYAASKSGVARLTESLAEELRGSGITVNAILPTIIDTPANRAAMPQSEFAKWATPAGIARVIAFLLSDEASEVTGALIPVSGAN